MVLFRMVRTLSTRPTWRRLCIWNERRIIYLYLYLFSYLYLYLYREVFRTEPFDNDAVRSTPPLLDSAPQERIEKGK